MTLECMHERVEFRPGGIVGCLQCKMTTVIGDGRCARCRKPLDAEPHKKAEACA